MGIIHLCALLQAAGVPGASRALARAGAVQGGPKFGEGSPRCWLRARVELGGHQTSPSPEQQPQSWPLGRH